MITIRHFAALFALILATVTLAAPSPSFAADYDFGNSSSATLTGKAWKASESGDLDAVKAYTGRCRELYEAQAVKMQSELTEPAPKEKANQYWALNDVGTCLFILGNALEKAGDKKGALENYSFLATRLSYAQCWDTKGWFWKPADAAKSKISALEFETASEAPAKK
ncbi:MAG: beta-glucanase precursor [Candidatus Methylacidiphilales bacterium]|nr:hypothetical protein [Candidatus Methylacidiphilales bacterium]